MLANNLRVGTLCSVSFFSFSDGVRTMTLPDVTELFGTDEKCRELLERLRWPLGPQCPRCNTHNVVRLETNTKLLWCRDCEYQFTVTAGTIFNDSHLPLSKWQMGIVENGSSGYSELVFAVTAPKQLGISFKPNNVVSV